MEKKYSNIACDITFTMNNSAGFNARKMFSLKLLSREVKICVKEVTYK